MAGSHFVIPLLLIVDGGHEVELGVAGVAADHAVGAGEPVEEAIGFIVFPSEGRCQTFQIHPNHATLPFAVKMRVPCSLGERFELSNWTLWARSFWSWRWEAFIVFALYKDTFWLHGYAG